MALKFVKPTAAVLFLLFITPQVFAQWIRSNGPWGGQVYDIAVNNGTIYVGTYGGVFISRDNGNHWTMPENCTMEGMVAFAVQHGSVYAGSFGRLFVTNDDGTTWTDLSSGLPGGFELLSIATTGNTVFAGFDDDPIYYSNDNGRTWNNTHQRMTTFNIWVHDNILLAGGSTGLYRSIDNGQTWDVVDSTRHAFACIAIDTVLLVGSNNGIIRSLDGGTTWEEYNAGFSGNEVVVKDLILVNGSLFAASAQGVYRSSDSGASWVLSAEGLGGQGVGSLAVNGTAIFAGTSPQGIFRSTDNGAHWEAAATGMTNVGINDILIEDDMILAGCDGGIALSNDKGMHWQWAGIDQDVYVVSLVKNGEVLLAGTMGSGLYRSRDNGLHWTCIDSSSRWYEQLTIGNGGYYAKIDNVLRHSRDTGLSWTPCLNEKMLVSFLVAGDTVFAGARYDMYLSTDNCSTWVHYDTATMVNYHIPSSFTRVGTVIYSWGLKGVYRSIDNGISWTGCNAGLGDTAINSFVASGTTLFAGTLEHGVYLSVNDGDGWLSAGTDISGKYVKSLAVDGTTIYTGIIDDGLWQRPISEMVGTSGPDPHKGFPESFTFSTHSPAGAATPALISFSLIRTEKVTAGIFDLSGRCITSIVNTRLHAGTYRYQWNAMKYPPGCYFVRIMAGAKQAVDAITVVH